LFSGEMPFQADTWIALSYKIIHDEPPVLTGKHPSVTTGIEAAMKRAISKQPSDRFTSCTEFIEALCSAAPETKQVKALAAAAPKRRNLILVGAAMAVMLGGIYWIYPVSRGPVPEEVGKAATKEMPYVPPAAATTVTPKAEPAAAKAEVEPRLIEFVIGSKLFCKWPSC
jgi:hypothetical protein